MHKLLLITLAFCSTLYSKEGKTQETKVKISTEYGDMIAVLFDKTPKHRDNFIKLTKEHFYDGTLFHRVIKDFMIQGGDPNSKDAEMNAHLGNGGPGYTIPAEINADLFHKKGALSAARLGDNANPKRESSGSQFYIVQGKTYDIETLNAMEKRMVQSAKNNACRAFLSQAKNKMYLDRYQKLHQAKDQEGVKTLLAEIDPLLDHQAHKSQDFSQAQQTAYSTVGGTPHLDHQYTVFGQIIEGLEIIDKIAATQTGKADRPIKDIKMTVTLLNK